MADPTYSGQKTYHKQGGDIDVIASGGKQSVESGGEIEVESGGTFDLQSGASMFWASTSIDGREAELAFLSDRVVTQHGSADFSSGATALSPAYGYHMLSAATGASLGSLVMPAASYGAKLVISGSFLIGDGNVSAIGVSTTGLILNARGSDLSSFEMSAGKIITLACTVDGTWNVVGLNNFTQHPSS